MFNTNLNPESAHQQYPLSFLSFISTQVYMYANQTLRILSFVKTVNLLQKDKIQIAHPHLSQDVKICPISP